MIEQIDYPHFVLPVREIGKASLRGGGSESEVTKNNRANPGAHKEQIMASVEWIRSRYIELVSQRNEDLSTLPINVPLVLKCDPDEIDFDFLLGLGFEVITEDSDGIVIVATDGLSFEKLSNSLAKLLEGRRGGGSAARLHTIVTTESTEIRLQKLLAPQILDEWPNIQDA